MEDTENKNSQGVRKKRFAPKHFILPIFALLVLASIGLVVGYKHLNNNPFPAAVRKNINYTLYYPTQLPAGYTVDKTSFQNPQSGIVTFNIIGPTGLKIGVSEAALPTNLNLSARENVPAGVRLPTINFSTGIGQATIDQWAADKVSYVVTDKTWIILNVTKLSDDTIKALTRSFNPV